MSLTPLATSSISIYSEGQNGEQKNCERGVLSKAIGDACHVGLSDKFRHLLYDSFALNTLIDNLDTGSIFITRFILFELQATH